MCDRIVKKGSQIRTPLKSDSYYRSFPSQPGQPICVLLCHFYFFTPIHSLRYSSLPPFLSPIPLSFLSLPPPFSFGHLAPSIEKRLSSPLYHIPFYPDSLFLPFSPTLRSFPLSSSSSTTTTSCHLFPLLSVYLTLLLFALPHLKDFASSLTATLLAKTLCPPLSAVTNNATVPPSELPLLHFHNLSPRSPPPYGSPYQPRL